MLIFFFISAFVLSTLKHGDDPYKILGVSKSASKDEIKKAFREMTKKYHPDVTKLDKAKAEKIWIRANDAYELLSDDARRERYDRTGSVSDDIGSDSSSSYHQSNSNGYTFYYSSSGGPFEDFFHFNFGQQNVELKTEEVNTANFEKLLKENKEMVILVCNPKGWGMLQYIDFFSDVATEFEDVIKICHNNIQNDNTFYRTHGIRSVPSFIYVKKNNDGTITKKINDNIQSREDLINWIEKCWNLKIKYFKSFAKAQKWINSDSGYTKVLSIERGNYPSMAFKKASSIYRHCQFAVLIDDYINAIRELHLTEFPTTLLFRRGEKIEIKSLSDLKQFSNPLFSKIERESLNNECYDLCYLRIGKPNNLIISNFSSFTDVPLTWISSSSNFAKSMKLHENDWLLISGKTNSYAKIDISQISSIKSQFLQKRIKMHVLKHNIDLSLLGSLCMLKNKIYSCIPTFDFSFISNIFSFLRIDVIIMLLIYITFFFHFLTSCCF